jgi:hypothetical protein
MMSNYPEETVAKPEGEQLLPFPLASMGINPGWDRGTCPPHILGKIGNFVVVFSPF